MSSTQNIQIKMVSKGIKKDYLYRSFNSEYPIGSIEMYDTFNMNFENENNTLAFFTTNTGRDLLYNLLSFKGYKLFKKQTSDVSEYVTKVDRFFVIIIRFFLSISSSITHESVYNFFKERIGSIIEKLDKESSEFYPNIDEQKKKIVSSLQKIETMNISIVTSSGSILGTTENIKSQIVGAVVPRNNNDIFLSPVDNSVADDIKIFCKNFLGEGKTISSEADGMNLESNGKKALLALQYLMNLNLSSKEYKKYAQITDSSSSSSSSSDSDNNSSFVSNRSKMTRSSKSTKSLKKVSKSISPGTYFISYTGKADMAKFNSNNTSNINVFLKFVLKYPFLMRSLLKIYTIICQSTTISYIPIENFELLKSIFNSFLYFTYTENRDRYFGGTKEQESLIRGHDGVSQSVVTIPIQVTKSIMDFISSVVSPASLVKEQRAEAKKLFDLIYHDQLGAIVNDVGGDEGPDEWQMNFIEAIDRGESVILVGDTSGGKTAISLFQMRKLFKEVRNESDISIIYIAPTDVLANQQYANMIKQFYENKDFIGACTESFVDIPSTCRLLIGTPHEVRNYLYRSKMTNQCTIDNVSDVFALELANPSIIKTKKLFVDEVQTMSLAYAQDTSIEQQMNCRDIEDIICILNNPGTQFIGMSATLSEGSIKNLQSRVQILTGIQNISVIRYTFDDIGFKRNSRRETFRPIMQKQKKYVVKYSDGIISEFDSNSKIHSQELSSNLIDALVRKAKSEGTFPFGIFCGTELETISVFEMFISYLERKSSQCIHWQSIKSEYDRNRMNRTGGSDLLIINKEEWMNKIDLAINEVIRQTTDTPIQMSDFQTLLPLYNKMSRRNLSFDNIILSPELYGLMYEYVRIANNNLGFEHETHPYYRFGNDTKAGDLFTLYKGDGSPTAFKKILDAQNANPESNTGNIIPLILKGLKFGVGVLTQSIPYGFQIKIFELLNVKSGKVGEDSPLPVIFCDYGMSAGVNVSFLACAILLKKLTSIGVSIFTQINGRSGRRGVKSTIKPVTYTFNIENANDLNVLEDLTFENPQNGNFFNSNDLYTHLLRILVKFENNKQQIISRDKSYIENIISGDTFKNITEHQYPLKIRRIHLAKCQIRELFDRLRFIIPTICNTTLKILYAYLQEAEFNELNAQTRSH